MRWQTNADCTESSVATEDGLSKGANSPLKQYSQDDNDSLKTAVESPADEKPLSDKMSTQAKPQHEVEKATKSVYPWSRRQLILPPPRVLPASGVQVPTQPSPSPFPRYGHSLPVTAAATEELFLFGGLVEDVLRNDLYVVSTNDASATLLQTAGEVPPPRVGHASAVIGSVLIVWGGDTKSNGGAGTSNKRDDGLYLLNLGECVISRHLCQSNRDCIVSREWTRIDMYGPSPVGRYGHGVCMIGPKFYIFGGQAEGEFFNDLWAFDLQSGKSMGLLNSDPRLTSVSCQCEPGRNGSESSLPKDLQGLHRVPGTSASRTAGRSSCTHHHTQLHSGAPR